MLQINPSLAEKNQHVQYNSIGVGIGCVPTSPLQISTYASSTQTYKFWNYDGVGGVGTYSQNYSIY